MEVPPCQDDFRDRQPAGGVVGTRSTSGHPRVGVDVERVMEIDDDGLRIGFFERSGWAKEVLAYGPFERRPGLALAVFLLNGHNSSDTHLPPEGEKAMLRRWARGQFRRPYHDDNLAVGWFADPVTADPTRAGSALVMHATGARNGELRARGEGTAMRLAPDIANVPLYLVVVLRERGAAYYVASVLGAEGAAGYSHMRPIGIDGDDMTSPVHAAIHQCVLGQAGFQVDSRVYGVRVDVVDELAGWCGSAHVAHRGPLVPPFAEPDRPPTPTGLIRAVTTGDGDLTIVFRAGDDGSRWTCTLGGRGCELACTVAGESPEVVALVADRRLGRRARRVVQIVDDGARIAVHVDGELLLGDWIDDRRLGEQVGVGLAGRDVTVEAFEAHPRLVPIPAALDMGAPWTPHPTTVAFEDRFLSEERVELAGRDGWERTSGDGVIELVPGRGALVRASREAPNPGQTLYTVPWDQPSFAEIEAEMTPPGTARHEGHRGRGGVVFWQEPGTHLIVNVWLDDEYPGTAISAFLSVDGHCEWFRSVWVNVGRTITYGQRATLSVAFDGERFTVAARGWPVLHRALRDIVPGTPRLAIRRVGLAVNWEYGDDTGTAFHRVAVRR